MSAETSISILSGPSVIGAMTFWVRMTIACRLTSY
jgi:hypothetical protein